MPYIHDNMFSYVCIYVIAVHKFDLTISEHVTKHLFSVIVWKFVYKKDMIHIYL